MTTVADAFSSSIFMICLDEQYFLRLKQGKSLSIFPPSHRLHCRSWCPETSPESGHSPGTRGLAGASSPAVQVDEMRSLAALGTAAVTFLLALLCPCWYLAMAETGKLLLRAQYKSQKI